MVTAGSVHRHLLPFQDVPRALCTLLEAVQRLYEFREEVQRREFDLSPRRGAAPDISKAGAYRAI
jgi:hypothetical protein